jgi:hypothetical protein
LQEKPEYKITPIVNAKIGVAAGLWLGDPDTHAVERLVKRPQIMSFSDAVKAGLAVKAGVFTPFNSQNTAYAGELALLMPMLPGLERYDDIWASYLAERIMMETGHLVHFGPSLVWQERHPHNLNRDIAQELYGMEHTERFIEDLRALDVSGSTPLDRMRKLYAGLEKLSYLPQELLPFGRAWCEDVYDAMKG